MGDEMLQLIDLDQRLPGQRRFISCWVGSHEGRYFLVDPGPPSTGDFLVASLEALHLPRLDFILLTHIHLDHAGSTAQVLERWPEAQVFCHQAGRPHLVDPVRLWQGSLKVLGAKAEVYGEPQPVPESALIGAEVLAEKGISVVPTPGHAPHHVSFFCGDNLFLGESAGTFSDLGRAEGSLEYYLRPATPPRFFPEIADGSLLAMLDHAPLPKRLCFAHHGQFQGDGAALLEQARRQLKLWVEVVRESLLTAGVEPGDGSGVENLVPQLIGELRRRDLFFARGTGLPEDIRLREDDFTRQTLRGMTGYLART
jgi:glyoxylase-like metal-dependent hydrolase (beta-lactamase superfamily II)